MGEGSPSNDVGQHEAKPVVLFTGADTIIRGYINDEAATKQTFHGDWLRTGDIGKLQNGNLWITDRFKEVRSLDQLSRSWILIITL